MDELSSPGLGLRRREMRSSSGEAVSGSLQTPRVHRLVERVCHEISQLGFGALTSLNDSVLHCNYQNMDVQLRIFLSLKTNQRSR